MIWTETKYGDYEAPGFVIVRQVGSFNFALYRTYKNSNQADGKHLFIGPLQECKEKAENI